jgi:hypothetical protein
VRRVSQGHWDWKNITCLKVRHDIRPPSASAHDCPAVQQMALAQPPSLFWSRPLFCRSARFDVNFCTFIRENSCLEEICTSETECNGLSSRFWGGEGFLSVFFHGFRPIFTLIYEVSKFFQPRLGNCYRFLKSAFDVLAIIMLPILQRAIYENNRNFIPNFTRGFPATVDWIFYSLFESVCADAISHG